MSDEVICPYCGSAPWSVSPRGEGTRNIRCDRCGGVFEYIPGFGAFSLPEMGRRGSMGDLTRDRFVSTPGPSIGADRYDFPQPEEEKPDCCSTCCCICVIFLIMPYILFFILLPGWFF